MVGHCYSTTTPPRDPGVWGSKWKSKISALTSTIGPSVNLRVHELITLIHSTLVSTTAVPISSPVDGLILPTSGNAASSSTPVHPWHVGRARLRLSSVTAPASQPLLPISPRPMQSNVQTARSSAT
ncbi:uncharacterized protein LY79DRAFT_580434 [Colletotrichum navitas]|uniref:Uncharacterized protein n=1 Tax=Colletotrichum navitas TaxID=681940 RepID=A0AAD8V2G8_9PEZI|nr:uncharacterized protein LY79DRAFT_580434 [Colletotrichum navitas]KAK1589815.1 hypothetical protein LY79DRAFT_580434 [Colletotrichum navitas]